MTETVTKSLHGKPSSFNSIRYAMKRRYKLLHTVKTLLTETEMQDIKPLVSS